jgi:hypothetical protein
MNAGAIDRIASHRRSQHPALFVTEHFDAQRKTCGSVARDRYPDKSVLGHPCAAAISLCLLAPFLQAHAFGHRGRKRLKSLACVGAGGRACIGRRRAALAGADARDNAPSGRSQRASAFERGDVVGKTCLDRRSGDADEFGARGGDNATQVSAEILRRRSGGAKPRG